MENSTPAQTERLWYRSARRTYLLDFQMPDSLDQMPIGQRRNLENLDPAAIVARLQKAGVKALYVHAKDNQGNCYYQSQFGHRFSAMGERDWMKEFSAACRGSGIVPLYYVQLSRERRGSGEDLYAARNEDGSKVALLETEGLLPSPEAREVMCLIGPGREYQINCLVELASRYDFDGFWLDAPTWFGRVNPCYCEYCRSKYAGDVGEDLPSAADKRSPAWKKYFRWRQRMNVVWREEIRRAIRRANPRLSIVHNSGAMHAWQDWDFVRGDDYASHEFHYNDGMNHLSRSCKYNEAVLPGGNFEIEVWRFFNLLQDNNGVKMSRGYQVRPLAALETEMASILANGGIIQYYDQINPDGSLDERSLDLLEKAFSMVEGIEPKLQRRKRLLPYAGVVWSKNSEAYSPRKGESGHADERQGMMEALLDERAPFVALPENRMEADDFRDCKVVILPDVDCLSDGACARLREYVKAGGGLVATYRTSCRGPKGELREDFGLSDLFGARFLETFTYRYGFVKFAEEHPLTSGLPLNWPMTQWQSCMLKVDAIEDAEALGRLVNPMRGFPMGHPPAEETPFPAAVVRHYGKGRVVYLPLQLGLSYLRYGHPDHRRLILNAVRWAAGAEPEVQFEGPRGVEMVAWDLEGGGRQVHLVNRVAAGPGRSSQGAVIEEVAPVAGGRLVFAQKIAGVTIHPGNTRTEARETGRGWEVELPILGLQQLCETF